MGKIRLNYSIDNNAYEFRNLVAGDIFIFTNNNASNNVYMKLTNSSNFEYTHQVEAEKVTEIPMALNLNTGALISNGTTHDDTTHDDTIYIHDDTKVLKYGNDESQIVLDIAAFHGKDIDTNSDSGDISTEPSSEGTSTEPSEEPSTEP